MRVFIKYISADPEHTVHYFTCKLDKQKHKMQKDSFMVEILDKVARCLNSPVVNPSEKLVWLAPNHQLMDLEPIEPEDMLVIGTLEDLRRFEQTYCVPL